jgi:hypothetical protein
MNLAKANWRYSPFKIFVSGAFSFQLICPSPSVLLGALVNAKDVKHGWQRDNPEWRRTQQQNKCIIA